MATMTFSDVLGNPIHEFPSPCLAAACDQFFIQADVSRHSEIYIAQDNREVAHLFRLEHDKFELDVYAEVPEIPKSIYPR